MTRLQNFARKLRGNTAAVAMTEFALGAPILLTASLFGIESANLTLVHMRVNQTAIHVADHASRIGDISQLESRAIYEADINDLLLGAQIHFSNTGDLYKHGRVILSSLEVVPDSVNDQQYIHWQRCKGLKVYPSTYGNEGDGLSGGSFKGMGPQNNRVKAQPGDAVMFVEVSYEYQPLFSDWFTADAEISAYSAFTVRADRDLTQIYQVDDMAPDEIQVCSKHDEFADIVI